MRHGETDWNAQGRLQGQTDVPLNAVGRAQAEEVGRRVADLDPQALDYVASPLERTRETMKILRAAAGLPAEQYRSDPRFAEMRFGSWEGSGWKELRRLHPKLYRAREEDRWHFVPPAGGESYAELVVRVAGALRDLLRPTVLASHGGVARAMMTAIGGASTDEALRASIWQGRILRFEAGRFVWM